VADKSSQLVLSALSRAAAEPSGVPLHGGKSSPGLFPSTAAGKQAAQRCAAEGFLRPAAAPAPAPAAVAAAYAGAPPGPGEAPPRKTRPAAVPYMLTDKGLAHLLGQLSPREVLEDFVRVLESRQGQACELLDAARQMQAGIEALKASAERVLENVTRPESPGAAPAAPAPNYVWQAEPAGPPSASDAAWDAALVDALARWRASGASEDCPLPHLFHQACSAAPDLTVGRFHDALRRLYDAGRVYLHPWTGPLYALPEPPYALLVGHEIAYYASLKGSPE
jgi:hypothetical protein